MATGSIVVDLLARTGSFITDIARSEKELKKLRKEAEEFGKSLRNGMAAAAAGTVVAAYAFDKLLKSAADFKDFEEMAGGAAEDFASLSIAAAGAGVSMESIVGATVKLTKGLTGVDDESKAAGAALAALGINIEEFKRLDPVAQYEAVGKALAQFADGAEKTAVAQALFGKSGAEQLKVFKALEEQGGRQVVLTQAQIEAADAYADAQAVALEQLKQFAQVAAVQVLPAVTDLVEVLVDFAREMVGVDNATKQLTEGKGLQEFAETTALVFAKVIDIGVAVVKTFEAVGKTIAASIAIANAASRGAAGEAAAIAQALEEDIKRITTYTSLTERLEKQQASRRAAEAAAAANPASYSNEGRSKNLPTLNYQGPQSDAEAKKAAAAAARAEEERQKAILKAREAYIDDQVKLVEKQFELEQQAAERFADAGRRVMDSVRSPGEVFTDTMKELQELLDRGAISWDTYGRAAVKAQEDLDAATEAASKRVEKQSEFAAQAARNIQDFLGQGLEDVLSGNFDNIAQNFGNMLRRMAAQALAADLNEKLFGKGGDGNGGLLASLIGAIGGIASGIKYSGTSSNVSAPNYENQMDLGYSFAVGTNYIPHDMVAQLHEGEAVVPKRYNPAAGGQAPNAATNDVQIINNGPPVKATATSEKQPDGRVLQKIILDTIERDVRAGGRVAKAQQDTYGLARQLPRR